MDPNSNVEMMRPTHDTVNPMITDSTVDPASASADTIPQEIRVKSFSTAVNPAIGIGTKGSMERYEVRNKRERAFMGGLLLILLVGVIMLLLAINIDGFCIGNCKNNSEHSGANLMDATSGYSKQPSAMPTKMPSMAPTAMPSSGLIDLSSILKDVRAPYLNRVPAMSMMVVSSDEILAMGHTGTTVACTATLNTTTNEYDQASGCGEDVLSSSVWSIGSVTKSMTTMLIAECVESASCPLNWTTTLGTVFDSAKQTAYANVTINSLTAMRGGFPAMPVSPDNTGFWYYATTGKSLVAQRQAMAEATFRNNTPAAPLESDGVYGYLYSNLGFVVAGHILEKLTNYTTPWEAMITDFWSELNMTSAVIGLPHGAHDASGTYSFRCGSTFCGFSPEKYDYLQCSLSMNPLEFCITNEFRLSPDNPPVMSPAGESSMNLTTLARYLQWVMKAERGQDVPVVSKETIQYMLRNSSGYPMGGGYTYTHGFVVDYTPCEKVFGESCVYYLGSEGSIWTMQYFMAPKANRIFIIGTNGNETIGAMAADSALQKVAEDYPELLG